MKLSTLTCKRDFELAFYCINNILRRFDTLDTFSIFDDGTLNDGEWERLTQLSEKVSTHPLQKRENAVLERLHASPNARALRKTQPLAYKLLDLCVLSEGPICYIDSDILFLKTPLGLFDNTQRPFLCKEDDQGYSASLFALKGLPGKQIPNGGNTGIFCLPKAAYDLEFVEWFLSQPQYLQFPTMAEQTILSLLINGPESQHLDYTQFPNSKYRLNASATTIGLHFMGNFKERWKDYAQLSENENAETVVFRKLQNLGTLDIIKRRIKRMTRKEKASG